MFIRKTCLTCASEIPSPFRPILIRKLFHGRISYVAASLDPSTRTLQARIETGNPGEKLKKDMYVTATVNAGAIKNAIALPDAAVLRDSDSENQPFVYAAAGSGQFGRRAVTVGESLNGQTEITSGLKAGDQVIGNGSLFLAVREFAAALTLRKWSDGRPRPSNLEGDYSWAGTRLSTSSNGVSTRTLTTEPRE